MRASVLGLEIALAIEIALAVLSMITIHTPNPVSAFARGTPSEMKWLDRYLTIDHRDGTQEYLLQEGTAFPAGLVPVVQRAAKSEGYAVEVVEPTAARLQRSTPDLSWLRTYQREAVDVWQKHDRGIIWAPPGAGKGEIAVALGMLIEAPWVYVVHRTTLAQDIAARWAARTGLRAGLVAGGKWNVEPTDRFICATFSGLHSGFARNDLRAEDLVDRTRALLVDECHVTAASTHAALLRRFDKSWVRVGLSGTPLDRGDGRSAVTIGALGPVRFKITAERLVQEGAILRGRVTFVRHRVGTFPRETNWGLVYNQCVVRSTRRNELVRDVTAGADKPALVFTARDEHGERLLPLLQAAGVRATRVWGDTKTEERLAAARALQAGELDVVVCSVVWQEGLDIPALRTVVNASAGKSTIASVQKSGRGARLSDGKVLYRLIDIWDVGTEGSYFLTHQAKARLAAYTREAHTIEWA